MAKRSATAGWRHMLNSAIDVKGAVDSPEPDKVKKPRLGVSKAERQKLLAFNENAKMLILMVGKPSRKTMLAAKLVNYISWLGYKAKMFKTSDVRLEKVGKVSPDFFDPDNPECAAKRQEFFAIALNKGIRYLTEQGGDVVIIDGGNYTRSVSETRRCCSMCCVGVMVCFGGIV